MGDEKWLRKILKTKTIILKAIWIVLNHAMKAQITWIVTIQIKATWTNRIIPKNPVYSNELNKQSFLIYKF